MTPSGPSRNMPASRSRIAPKTLGESKRGRQSHSTFPLGATSAHVVQSERNPYSAIGGKGLAPTPTPARNWLIAQKRMRLRGSGRHLDHLLRSACYSLFPRV